MDRIISNTTVRSIKMCTTYQIFNKLGPILVLSFLCLAMAGCTGENVSDLQTYVQEVKARKKANVEELPKVQTYATYTYNSAKLRDPFEPVTTKRKQVAGSGPKPSCKAPRDVLEQFPLDSLKLVGSLEQKGQRWALIKAQDGTLYRTKKGKCMGQDNGKIVKVTDTEIVLMEIVPDGLGGYIERKTVLSVTQ